MSSRCEEIQINQAQVSDAMNIATTHILSWQQAYADYIPKSVLDDLSVQQYTANWEKWITNPDSHVYKATIENKVVGFISFGNERSHIAKNAEIWTLYTHPNFSRRGIGRQLVATALFQIAKHRYSNVVLWVLENNSSAQQFYQSVGFVKTEQSKSFKVAGSIYLTEFQFICPVTKL